MVPGYFFYYILALFAPFLIQRWPKLYACMGCLVSLFASPLPFYFLDTFPFEHITFTISFLSFSLHLLNVSPAGLVFAWCFSLASFFIFLYGLHQKDLWRATLIPLYIGSALGSVLAGDLLSFFVFIEAMMLLSALMIFSQRSSTSFHGALYYLFFHIFSSLLLLIGILFSQKEGNTSLLLLPLKENTLTWFLIAVSFVAKAALFPFHAWLVQSYDETDDISTLALSIFSTKSIIYGFIVLMPASPLWVSLGFITMIYSLYWSIASLNVSLRRAALYFLNYQLGFMVLINGLGFKREAIFYAFNHVVYDLLLFSSLGYLFYAYKTAKIEEVPAQLYKAEPLAFLAFLIAVMSMLGAPFTLGFYVKGLFSKMIHDHPDWSWIYYATQILLTGLIASVLLLLHRLFIEGGGQKANKIQKGVSSMPVCMNLVFLGGILLCVIPFFWQQPLTYIFPSSLLQSMRSIQGGKVLMTQVFSFILACFLFIGLRLITFPTFPKVWHSYQIGRVIVQQLLFELLALITFARIARNATAALFEKGVHILAQPRLRFALMEWQGFYIFLRGVLLILCIALLMSVFYS